MKICQNQDLESMSSRELVKLECERCHNIFCRPKHYVQVVLKSQSTNGKFHKRGFTYCSKHCILLDGKSVICKNCGKTIYRSNANINKSKSGFYFCSHSCFATYSNLHKTTGTRRSKIEVWIADQLTNIFQDLKIIYNSKTIIGSELDIYIPSLCLAFEINGIYHYEPIHGQKKFASITKLDAEKLRKCIEKEISLIVISGQDTFSPETSQPYLNTIMNKIISVRL